MSLYDLILDAAEAIVVAVQHELEQCNSSSDIWDTEYMDGQGSEAHIERDSPWAEHCLSDPEHMYNESRLRLLTF